ncbi:S41 family peptidase [Candidatus Saccharibacteria bacterium]|nr:S41 family peptidase [Candidatus Saccharibacteria bacterium]
MSKKEWKERKVSLGGAIIGAVVTLAVGLGLGIYWNEVKDTFLPYLGIGNSAQHKSNIDWSALDEVYNTLLNDYDGDIDKSAVIEGAKAGLVAALGDPYTEYMTADQASDYQKSLHGEVAEAGIGVVMGKRDDYVRITRTLPDNPAREAGVLAGDIIYKIDGELVYHLESDEIAKKLRGDAGTKVSLTVIRGKEEKTFELTREKINNVSADITYNGDTAVILTTRFDTDTGTIIEKEAQNFAEKGIKKVILDLRDNGGGYVSAAQDLASLWIDGEVVCTQKSKFGSSTSSYASHGKAVLKDMETVVLVNGSTASASEIVAGALKDYGKATIVGEKTYGKGVVQALKNLSNSTLLKVTTAHWYTPNGTSIDQTGIAPDKEVKRTWDDINSDKDPQLDAALKM